MAEKPTHEELEQRDMELGEKFSKQMYTGMDLLDYQIIFNNIQVGLYIYHLEDIKNDTTLKMISANHAAADFTGVQVADVVGKTLDENFPGLREKGIPQKYAEVVRSGKAIVLEDVYYNDTRVIEGAFSVKAFPLPNNCVGVSFENITGRKQAEKLLQKKETLLNITQQLAEIGGWEVDLEKQITFWTDEVYRIHDLQPDEFTSIDEAVKLSLKCYAPEDRQVIMDAFRKCAKEGQAYDLEFPFTTIKGRRKWIRTIINPVMEGGRVIRVVGYFMNITERKKATEEKKTLETQLQQAQKMETIGTLAGGIAHDFNNILFPIVGFTEMMLDNAPEGSDLRDSLNEVLTASLRASDLVQQILTFSRQTEKELKPLKTHMVIGEVLRLMRASLPTTISIKQDIDKNCGMVLADPTQVQQIAMNLITNAYHSMEEGGGTLTITLSEVNLTVEDLSEFNLNPGRFLLFSVSDTGHGIKKHILERIFEPYFTTKDKEKGTGLGLSVVHGIIKSYKGDIRVNSEPDKGTVFNVYLPIIQSKKEVIEIENHFPLQGGNEHILLVDDEEQILKMEKQMLERLGYQVTTRTSSIEALEAFRALSDKFDIVITDMTMPNMTGEMLAYELKQIRKKLPVILCTGFSEKITKEKAEALGIDGFLMKPIVKSELSQKVRAALDSKKNG